MNKIKITLRSRPELISKQTSSERNTLKVIDLFSGTGAFSLAFSLAFQDQIPYKNNMPHSNEINRLYSVDVVFANDVLEHSMKIYKLNFPDTKNHFIMNDLHNIVIDTIPDFDLLTGGFPCQPFSIAGQRLGFEDSRSNVFWKIMEIVDKKHPNFLLLENVSNLINHDNGQTFKTIYDNLTIRGYNVVYKVLDTCKITGVPQHRERIYIFGYKIIGNKFLNQSNNTIQLLNSLLDFDQIYVKPITDFLQATNEIPDKYYYTPKSKIYPKLLESVTKYNTVYQYRRTYVRENMSGVVPTLTENMGSGGHNIPIILDSKGIRKLTPRECFNFQGFPSNYNIDGLSDSQLYRLAGNAVTYKIVEMIALKLKNILFGY